MKFSQKPWGPVIEIACLVILVGSLGGVLFPLVLRILSIDGDLSFREFLFSLMITSLVLNIFVLLVSTRIIVFNHSTFMSRVGRFFSPVQCKFVAIPGTLTLIIPLLGPLFGGTGKEPLWAFAILGIVGCLFWSIPLFAWFLISLLIKKMGSRPE